jgi:LysR family transcriptional activator of mexEF-oprN operon
MRLMNQVYARDLDLNLLRVFVVVAETGSATQAASRLYLTQPAISAALKRLSSAVGAPLLSREGRGLVLTARGKRLFDAARPHLAALVDAAFTPAAFDPEASERVVRLALSDTTETWLLPPLLAALGREAPRMQLVVTNVQFRTIGEAVASQRVDLAITVSDELPAGTTRVPLFTGGFVCLFDPRHARVGRRLTLERYLEHEHVIVSYNGDLRGVVEDFFGVTRRVRVSVPSFHAIGAIVDGSALIATVPEPVAKHVVELRPHLRRVAPPFDLRGSAIELVYRSALDDDDALRFVRGHIVRIAGELERGQAKRRRPRAAKDR